MKLMYAWRTPPSAIHQVSYQTNTEKSSFFCSFAKFLGLSDAGILHNFFVDKMLGDKTELSSQAK